MLPVPRQKVSAVEPAPNLALASEADLNTGIGRSLARLAALMRAELADPDGLIYQPILAGQLWHAVLRGLLEATADRLREDAGQPVSRPRAVKRAIDAMEAEPDRAFTVTTLAAAAGTSVRTLQEGFRQHVGMPPMAYLRHLRLARAHADLYAAEPGEQTVASVAHRWGFAHLGRFAAAYRAEYGRAPAETLHESPAGPGATTPARAAHRHAAVRAGPGATLPDRRDAAVPSGGPVRR